ncbi:MAG TPA: hypothetical protein VF891_00300 [Gaiellaceae bacterium]
MGTGVVHAVRARLTRPPLTLVASLAAALAFGIALLVGWATAGTREDLRRAQQQRAPKPPPGLVLLGAATPLPAAPPPRSSPARKTTHVPRLIVGSG